MPMIEQKTDVLLSEENIRKEIQRLEAEEAQLKARRLEIEEEHGGLDDEAFRLFFEEGDLEMEIHALHHQLLEQKLVEHNHY